MSCFVIRYVALTFEDEARCKAFHDRIREMFIRHSSRTWTYEGTEEITLEPIGGDEVDWHNQLDYVFKGRNEEERLVRIWTMGIDDARVKLSFEDMLEPDVKTLRIHGEQACWGEELFACFRQYLDGDFGLEQVKVVLWSEYNEIDVWCQNSEGECFYNRVEQDDFDARREELAEEQEVEDSFYIDDFEVFKTLDVLYGDSEYASTSEEPDMDSYPVFYDEEAEAGDGVEDEAPAPAEAAATEHRFCEQCGAELEPGSAFCEQCGASNDDAPVRSDGERTFYLPEWMRKNGGRK